MYVIHPKPGGHFGCKAPKREVPLQEPQKHEYPWFQKVPLREPSFPYSNLPRGDVSRFKPVRQHRFFLFSRYRFIFSMKRAGRAKMIK